MSKSEYREIVLEFCRKYSEKSNTEIAKEIAIMRNKPEDIEKIRTLVRYYRGVNGSKCRNKVAIGKAIREKYYKRFSLPKPKTFTDYKPVEFKAKIVLFICDTHFPDHDSKALEIALKNAKENNVDTIIQAGDIIDGFHLSKFDHDTLTPSFSEEIKIAHEWFNYLRQEFPTQQIIYKAGNHDLPRLQKYINSNARALANLEALKLENLLELKKYNIKYVEDKPLIKIGRLLFAHGHEFGGNPSVNVAKAIFNRVNENIIFGHFHHRNYHDEINVVYRTCKAAFSVGCLCNPQPEYRPYSKFQHGFAIVKFQSNGYFQVENKVIFNNKIV